MITTRRRMTGTRPEIRAELVEFREAARSAESWGIFDQVEFAIVDIENGASSAVAAGVAYTVTAT